MTGVIVIAPKQRSHLETEPAASWLLARVTSSRSKPNQLQQETFSSVVLYSNGGGCLPCSSATGGYRKTSLMTMGRLSAPPVYQGKQTACC